MFPDSRSHKTTYQQELYSQRLFPSKGTKLEEGTKVSTVFTNEDVLRNVCRQGFCRPRIPKTPQPVMGQEVHVMQTDFPLSTFLQNLTFINSSGLNITKGSFLSLSIFIHAHNQPRDKPEQELMICTLQFDYNFLRTNFLIELQG